jgi:hypothetical protein
MQPLLRLPAGGSPEESAHASCQNGGRAGGGGPEMAPEGIYFVLLLEGTDTGVRTCQSLQEASKMLGRYSP